ncbi:MAG: hypothetical protein CL946_06885 [Ectothiorhodospiraceae bacterium]|nr:hypothetical protein [Ectothiorhodospiraceae bacterium]
MLRRRKSGEHEFPPQLATSFIKLGARGAETRHRDMILRLRKLGFRVDVSVCDLRSESLGRSLRRYIPLFLNKFAAGVVASISGRHVKTFFAFESYSFIGGAIVARPLKREAVYFCRNDQIYEKATINSICRSNLSVPFHLYILQYFCLLLCDRYVVQSCFAAAHIERRFKSWPFTKAAAKIKVLENDLRISLHRIPDVSGLRRTRVGFIANPEWEKKGFFILKDLLSSEAFKSTDLSFTIVGRGDAFDRLRDEIGALPKERVRFHGFCDDIAELRELVDLVFVPSIVDHFPNVLIECAALGLPMLLSNIEAHRNILPNHPSYFDLGIAPQQMMDALLSLTDPATWKETAELQQRDIVRLKNAWQEPLKEIFQANAQVK